MAEIGVHGHAYLQYALHEDHSNVECHEGIPPAQKCLDWLQIELVAIPEEEETAQDIEEGKQRYPIGSSEIHDGQSDPVK